MDDRFADLERAASASALLGYLNFSQGRPDPRWQKAFADAYAAVAEGGAEAPWQVLHDWMSARLDALQAGGAAAFQDVTQARAVLSLVFAELLPAYRRHHADLLAHLSDRDLFQPFFLVRSFEAVLAQGGPWEDHARLVTGALNQLNDFLGYRPIAILENRPRGEPYEHERVRPIPLYLRGAGVSWGRYGDLIARALDILGQTDSALLADAQFDLQLLDELALDPRAYDHSHPVNRRPNYSFGEWDPHHLDNQGRYRRLVVRQVTLDALLERVEHHSGQDRGELLFEAAAVLAGTMLMATGISGSGPSAHDSGATLGRLMPGIARYREAFYARLLDGLSGPHGDRLRQETAATRQPFGGARQHLNQYLARQRAAQLQYRYLAVLFAEMGSPDAGRRAAARLPAVGARLLSEVLSRLAGGRLLLERGFVVSGPPPQHPPEGAPQGAAAGVAGAAALLPELDELLHRGIACGAFADPWNILGFQGLFPLSPAREDSIRDQRVDELVHLVEEVLGFAARLLSEASAVGEETLAGTVTRSLRRLANWWDQFASAEVSEVRRVQGGEALASAEHVATALARWHQRGESSADLTFWRQHLAGFRSPKAFALVVEALLRKHDHRAGLALLMNWLSQWEQVPLEDGEHSFHTLALQWMLSLTAGARDAAQAADTWPLVKKFFDYLEANAEDYWQVPSLVPELLPMPRAADEGEDLFGAAYEDVTYHDSTDDEEESSVAEGGGLREPFPLEGQAEPLSRRLRFLSTVARLWVLAAREDARWPADSARAEALAAWLTTARGKQQDLLALLDALQGCAIPDPSGSEESLVEYDRRRVLREQLLYQAIATSLDTTLAVGALHGAVGDDSTSAYGGLDGTRPEWEPSAIQLERALLHSDPAAARAALPRFLEHFRDEPLLFVALADGGRPRKILRARLAQAILRALVAALPRLGLLRETYHLLKAARAMEQAHPLGVRGVTEFNHLFEAGYQALAECVVRSSATWDAPQFADPSGDQELVTLLETLTTPFLALWVEHSRALQVSSLETVRSEGEWRALRGFIQRYGGDLFHTRFLTLANLRGILHRGVDHYLDYLRDNPDPLHPVRLIEDLDGGLPRPPVVRHLHVILQAVVENYEEYKDYNTTVAHSDYGQNLHLLLDFLRIKVSYERHAWQFRPLVLAHEVLARGGRGQAALLWTERFARSTAGLAGEHLAALASLEQTHGMRLGTVADRLGERFIKPLAVDRLCALIEPAMAEASGPGPGPGFGQLEQAVEVFAAEPTGVGLDVPNWLRRLEQEVHRVRASRTTLAVLAEDLSPLPERTLSFEELQSQLRDWDRPLEGE